MKDYLVRGTVKNRAIRVMACKTTDLVEVARQKHDLWPTSSAALGRMMSATLMMGSMLKDNEKLTVVINGGGPIGTMLCVTQGDGRIRGFVGDPHCMFTNNRTGKLDVGYAVGTQGYLQVVRDMGLKEPFTSQIPLQTGEIGDDFTAYYAYSEQTPSAVSLGVLVGVENEILASGGFMVQMLPEATDEDVAYVEEALKDFPAVSSLIHEGSSPEDILRKLFSDVEILGSQDLCFECPCSKASFEAGLMTLGKQELLDMIAKDHGCEVTCQFCNTKYQFSETDLLQLVADMEKSS
ncbi:33 kDa chaperonin [Clostridiales bacterium CHKCI006]|nr:33 kDa chaperonin [Clostridiales bacterium CHKCI006]